VTNVERYAVIEPGSAAWKELVYAIERGRAVSICATGQTACEGDPDAYRPKIKMGQSMWSPTLSGRAA